MTHCIQATVNSLTRGPMPTPACDHVGHGLGKTPFEQIFPKSVEKSLISYSASGMLIWNFAELMKTFLSIALTSL